MAESKIQKQLSIQFWDGINDHKASQDLRGEGTIILSQDSLVLGFVYDPSGGVNVIRVLNPDTNQTTGYLGYPTPGYPTINCLFMKAGTKIKAEGDKTYVFAMPITKMF